MNTLLTHTTDGKPAYNNVAQVLTNADGRMVAYGQMTHDEAQRIAACWNKFNDLTTADIDAMPGTVRELAEKIGEMIRQADAMKAFIKDVARASLDEAEWLKLRVKIKADSAAAAAQPIH